MTNNALVSIIIPMYNSEKTIEKCISSILNQCYKHFELIVVNDGSIDQSLEICKKFALKDKRIKVFNKPNGGASSARNFGLEHAVGKYICFVDSDDTVSQNYINDLCKGLINDHIDLVFQGYKSINMGKTYTKTFGEEVVKSTQYEILFVKKEIFKYGYVCSKLFKSSIVQEYGLKFPESYNFAEDLSFMLRYIRHCDSIHFQEKFNYNYIYHAESSSNTFKSSIEYLNRYHDYQKLLEEDYPDIYEDVYGKNKIFVEFCRSIGGAIFYYIQSIYKIHPLDQKKRLYYLEQIDEEAKSLLKNFKRHIKNPFYKIALNFIIYRKYYFADLILKRTIKPNK